MVSSADCCSFPTDDLGQSHKSSSSQDQSHQSSSSQDWWEPTTVLGRGVSSKLVSNLLNLEKIGFGERSEVLD